MGIYNELQEKMVKGSSIDILKKHLNKYVDGKASEEYGNTLAFGTNLKVKCGRHGHVGPQGLFPRCKLILLDYSKLASRYSKQLRIQEEVV